MPRRDALLATCVAVIWGLNFAVLRWALADLPPLLFASLRFAVVASLALVLPRPAVSIPRLLAYGFVWGALQYAGLFLGVALGVPAGVASVLVQSQVVFTMLGSFALRLERPRPHHALVMILAVLGVIAIVIGTRASLGVFAVLVGSAGWAAGNLLARRMALLGVRVDSLGFLSWACVPTAATLAVGSVLTERPAAILALPAGALSRVALALAYQCGLALIAGGIGWNALLRKHAPSRVAPFSLLVPVVGLAAGRWIFGEELGFGRALGCALIAAALVVELRASRRPSADQVRLREVSDEPRDRVEDRRRIRRVERDVEASEELHVVDDVKVRTAWDRQMQEVPVVIDREGEVRERDVERERSARAAHARVLGITDGLSGFSTLGSSGPDR
ncbi:MAG: EamA family transporter [Polyangiaceae bacterium]